MKGTVGTIVAALAAVAVVVALSWLVYGAIRGHGQGNGGPGTPPGVTVPGKTTTGSR